MQRPAQETNSNNSAHDEEEDEEEVDIPSPSSSEIRALEEFQEYQQNNNDDGDNSDASLSSPSSQSNDEKSEEESEEGGEEMPPEEEVNAAINNDANDANNNDASDNNNDDSLLINADVSAHDDESVPEETNNPSSDVLDFGGGHDLPDGNNNDFEEETNDNAVDDSTVGDNNETTSNNNPPIVNNDVNHQLLDGGDAQAGGNNNLQNGEDVEEAAAIDNNEVGLPTYTLTTFFMSMFHGMTIEQYLVYVQSLLDNNEQLELADLIVQTTHWHKMRCSGVSVKPFITAIHDSLAPTFEGLPTAVNLRNRYNGYLTGSPQPPVHPPMHIPPTIKPINIHGSGSVGQHCIRGEGDCIARRDGTAPTFHRLGNQYCDICDSCLSEEYALDISATFASKEAFHQAMTQHANRSDFGFRKIQGKKSTTSNLPVTLGVRCAASNNHDNCGFHIEVSLVENEYHYSKLVLGHSTDDA